MSRSWLLVAVSVSAAFLVACEASAPASNEAAQVGGASNAPAAAAPVQASATGGEAQNINLADIFPAGAGREQVLNACGSCHSVACVALGRKTAERWDTIKASHMETAGGSGADLDAMFAYLKEHFNDTKPEPKVPPQLLQQGCTPF